MKRHHPFQRKNLLVVLLLVVTITIFHGCTFKLPGQRDLQKIYVVNQVEPFLMLPQYIAMKQGYFTEKGINLVVADEVQEDRLCLTLTDTAHLLQRNASEVIFVQLARNDLVLIGRKEVADFTWSKLKNSSLILNKNSWNGRLGELAFRQEGIQPNRDFTQLYNIPEQLASSAFISGTGDFLATNLFEGTLLEQKECGSILASFNQIAGETLGAGYSTPSQNLSKHGNVLQDFVNAIYKAQLWMQQHSDAEIAQLVEDEFKEWPADTLANTISAYRHEKIFLKNPIVQEQIIKTTNQLSVQRGNHSFLQPSNINQAMAKKAVKTVTLEEPNPKKK